MLKDFHPTRHPGLQAILFSFKVLFLVSLLACVWEFGFEDDVYAASNWGLTPETVKEHLRYVGTITAFAFIALIAPTYTLYRYIKRRDQAENHAHHLAGHDSLTDLPNRDLLFDRLEHAIAHAHRHNDKLGVLFIDLDGFKGVNDLLGHNAGDFVLCATANRLKKTLRETDTVARFGGDEFVALITEVKSADQIIELTRVIKKAVTKPSEFEGTNVTVGASVGYAIYPDQASKPDDLICLADVAMYEDKKKALEEFLPSAANEPVTEPQA